jgi:hypothetical protein
LCASARPAERDDATGSRNDRIPCGALDKETRMHDKVDHHDILRERHGSAGIIRLNRPRALNSLTLEMIRGISQRSMISPPMRMWPPW